MVWVGVRLGPVSGSFPSILEKNCGFGSKPETIGGPVWGGGCLTQERYEWIINSQCSEKKCNIVDEKFQYKILYKSIYYYVLVKKHIKHCMNILYKKVKIRELW